MGRSSTLTEDLELAVDANRRHPRLVIDRIREPISTMSDINRRHTMKHIQNLSKLSTLYNNMI